MEHVKSLLAPNEIITPDSTEYTEQSRTWAAQKNLSPRLIARPRTVETLSKLLAYLDTTSLDIAIRCCGVGCASAKDVLISMSAFDSFAFNPDDETIVIGAGQSWGAVDRHKEAEAPGYAAVSARCTFVGVGGSTTTGGQSWLSSEHGLLCDPQNMLDAQVVKMDGRVVWASTEPDLLWALRGGGGAFGAVVAFKMRVYKYPASIYYGQIIYPPTALKTVAKAVADFAARCSDPQMALHLYCLDMTQGTYSGKEPKPGLAVFAYDAHGQEHGRSEEGFKWALDIEGCTDLTTTGSYCEVNAAFDSLTATMGVTNTWHSGVTVPTVEEQLILHAWEWYLNLLQTDHRLVSGSYVLVEVMQKAAYQSLEYPSLRSAWPHTPNQHNLQIGVGVLPGSDQSDAYAYKRMKAAPYEIRPGHTPADYFPNFIESFVDPQAVLGRTGQNCWR